MDDPIPEHVLRKIHHCTICPKKFSKTFFRILPPRRAHPHLSKILMTIFSHHPFLGFQPPLFYCLVTLYTPSSNLYPFYRPTHQQPVFPFLHLTFSSLNSKYYIRFLFLLTSSLHKQPIITAHFRSSLHIVCITAR